jgi:hypothetical protein
VDSKDTPLLEQVERVSHAAEGGKPGVMREITTTITAQITKVDVAKRMVTFRGPRETLRTVKVQDPNIDLASIKQANGQDCCARSGGHHRQVAECRLIFSRRIHLPSQSGEQQ